MKINPDDPCYPTNPGTDDIGMTIRLKLIAEMTAAIVGTYRQPSDGSPVQVGSPEVIADWAKELADAAIERANRDEESDQVKFEQKEAELARQGVGYTPKPYVSKKGSNRSSSWHAR